ncbi:MAG: hypothetical protein PHS92_02215 [Candidatus Gracilibacteria bacterium]|nr:hypothetical protein [Candidatus Gracilibacteria bacterium]
MFYAVNEIPSDIIIKDGDSKSDDNTTALGYNEASMMIKEKLVKGVGSEIIGLFGIDKIKIIGILSPTNKWIDDSYFINPDTFEKLKLKEDMKR